MRPRSSGIADASLGTGRFLFAVAALILLQLPARAGGALDGEAGEALTLSASRPHPGQIDPGFGDNGRASLFFSSRVPPTFQADEEAAIVLVQPDGKILAKGSGSPLSFALARFNADGSLDPGFGSGGILTSESVALPESLHVTALQLHPDGRIVAAGSLCGTTCDFALVRFNPDGTVDTAFGTDGVVTTHFPGATSSGATAVVLQPDGRIVAAGGGGGLVLVRYEPDGSLDSSFGTGGIAGANAASAAENLFLLADGRFVAALRTAGGVDLLRFNADGSLDTGYGTMGVVAIDFPFLLEALALQPDGRLLVLGDIRRKTYDFLLARFNPDGTADQSFGSHGSVATDFGGGEEFAGDLVLQPDGRIVVAGSTFNPKRAEGAFALARFTPRGRLDDKFGKHGSLKTFFSDLPCDIFFCISAHANTLVLQPDGRVVAAGGIVIRTEVMQLRGFALARYF